MVMSEQATTAWVRQVMTAFAERTGLVGGSTPTRYLWTDAFAVCNFLELEGRTGDGRYRALALRLVDQVHRVLGRHRADDPRTGWISGLREEDGATHPTLGGLRIGKPLNERRPDEPLDDRLEWDRDGQYFHYLTQWMHALARVGRVTGDPRYVRWALELAGTAHDRFTASPTAGGRGRLWWKMSIDLSRPLVDAMGQHDPLDGLITLVELHAAAQAVGEPVPVDFAARTAHLGALAEGARLATADPLGIGGLLIAAHRLARLAAAGAAGYADWLETLLDQAWPGLAYLAANREVLAMPPADRLAFRELGLAIGLRAVQRTQALLGENPAVFAAIPALGSRLERLQCYAPLIETIERFWLEPANRAVETWKEHENINAVMLATSLAPDGYLAL
jgi:hypothetical protein